MNRLTASLATVLLVATSLGCFPEIEELCEDVAIAECQQCFECAPAEGGPTGGQICGVEFDSDVDEEACITRLSDRCAGQASTLDEPKQEINECLDSQATNTCDLLLSRHAQNQQSSSRQCAYFL